MQKLPPPNTPIAKRRRFLINFAFFALLFILSIIVVRYALPALFPFVVAFIVTQLLRPIVRFCNVKLRINRRITSVLLVLLFYGTIGVFVIWILIEILQFAARKITNLPDFFQNQIRPMLNLVFDEIEKMLHTFDPDSALDFDDTVNSLLSTMSKMILDFSGNIVSSLTNVAVSVPSFLLNLVIMVISTIFLLVDYEDIVFFIKKQLSKFLDFDSDKENAAVLVNNYEWMKDFSFLAFIRDIGKHITVNYMMSKDSVKRRITGESGADGMSFTEFSYQLLQGYDYVYLNKQKSSLNHLIYCIKKRTFLVLLL